MVRQKDHPAAARTPVSSGRVIEREKFPVPRILVIEDDVEASDEIASCLSASGFHPKQSFDGHKGLEIALAERFDAITLDRLLPDRDGLEVLRLLREAGLETPVLMVSALGDVDDRVTGLRAGGDDYLVKPFAPTELVARLEVLLRRHRRAGRAELSLRVGDLVLDLVSREAQRDGRRIELLPMEFQLLEFMMRNPAQTLSRRMIFETVWEYYFDPGTNLIDVHVGRLRRKIDIPGAPSLIKTERGVGYVFNAA
jgi:two-component system OmpR family response regulator